MMNILKYHEAPFWLVMAALQLYYTHKLFFNNLRQNIEKNITTFTMSVVHHISPQTIK